MNTSNMTEIDRLVHKIETLETQYRWVRLALASGVVCLAAFLLMGQASRGKETVAARKFVLLDSGGNTRGEWSSMPDGGPYLLLADKTGMRRAVLRTGAAGSPGLDFFDDTGARVVVSLTGLALFDQKSKIRLGLRVNQDGSPEVGLLDDKAKARIALVLDEVKGPRIAVMDHLGKTIWEAPK